MVDPKITELQEQMAAVQAKLGGVQTKTQTKNQSADVTERIDALQAQVDDGKAKIAALEANAAPAERPQYPEASQTGYPAPPPAWTRTSSDG